MFKVIHHGVTIANIDWIIAGGCRSIRKWQQWRRVIIELSIKEPLFVHHLSVFFFEKLGLLPKKKIAPISGPDPLLGQYALVVVVTKEVPMIV